MTYIKQSKPNKFDNLKIDVRTLYKNFPINKESFGQIKTSQQEISFFNKLYSLPLIPLNASNAFWYLLHRTNLDSLWFDEFKKYWHQILGGLTLWGPQDFYFLRNIYRLSFQQSELPKNNNPTNHLKSWQNPEILYQLLDMVYRESLFNQIPALNLYLKFRNNDKDPIYEFGCGTAPITTSFFEFINNKNTKIYISDIQTVFFHYASFKFRKQANVTPILLQPESQFLPKLPQQVGTIFCMTVFEHLLSPLEVAKEFHKLLKPGGLLIFDYIKSDGKGMDTEVSMKERSKVLSYIKDNFEILHGSTEETKEAKIIVAKKH